MECYSQSLFFFVLIPSLSTGPAPTRQNHPSFSSYPKLSFPKIRTPLSRRIPEEDFSSLFLAEPEYKFDSFIIDCFICQKTADKDVKPYEKDIEDMEISDSHELNGNVAVVDEDDSKLTEVVVLKVSEEAPTEEDEEVENSTEVVF